MTAASSSRIARHRIERWARGVGTTPADLPALLAAMKTDEILEHDNVSVLRSSAGWIVRLGDGGVSLARTPDRTLHYVGDRMRLAEQVLAGQLDRLLRDPADDDSATFAYATRGQIVVQFSPLRGGFQTLSLTEARRYLGWLQAGNSGGPYLMPPADA